MDNPQFEPGHVAAPPATDSQRRQEFRTALLLNLVLPGAGQVYAGQRLLGISFAVLFLGCLITKVYLLFLGFRQYFRIITGDQLMANGTLEQLPAAFRLPWLIGLLAAGLAIFIAALVTLYLAPGNTAVARPEKPR